MGFDPDTMRFALVVIAVLLVSCISASSVEICVNVNDSSNCTSLATGSCDNGEVVVTVFQFSNCTGTNTSATLGTCDGSCNAGVTYNCGSSIWIWVIVIIVVIVIILAIVGAIGGFLFWKKKKSQTSYVYDD